MGERTQYTPGTFCWTDLTTTDQEAAKAFYTGLFGWDIEDMPAGENMTYSMARIDGKYVAAIAAQPPMQRDAGVPPMWNSYVSVESADDAAAHATELGATVHAPPFDVFDSGRMAVIQDPQGAFFEVWQPGNHFGAQWVNEPGALCWNELATTDMDAASAFYGELFGWNFAPFEDSPQPYKFIQIGEAGNGGITTHQSPDVPPHWLVYFVIDDIDAALAMLEELGGTKHYGPNDIGIAKIAIVEDPQGAMFALYDGQTQP